jgi:SAM-dependent methyltransferase
MSHPSADYVIKNEGFCYCCNSKVTFSSQSPWLRDHYKCSHCGSIPRERALMYVIEKFYPNWESSIIHESSPASRGASLKLKNKCNNYVATHFFADMPSGQTVQEYVNQNLEDQTFEDESFDLVITQDVMEHVFNPDKAFSEIARTLKRGGAHIFTVPLVNKSKPSAKWATINDDGTVNFLKAPEYHGNPIDKKGSPVSMHWGYDICEFIFRSSGLYTTIIFIDNLDLGIRAEYIEVLLSRKPVS